MWDEGLLAQARANTVQQEREEVVHYCNMQLDSTAWWMNGKTEKKKGNEASNGVVCCNQWESMHEVRKKQQAHDEARKVYGTCCDFMVDAT